MVYEISLGEPVAQVEIVEVGPRDGLQNEDRLLTVSEKVEFVERCVAAGLRRIEVAAFVHPERVPQMADAEALMAVLPRHQDVKYAGLVLNRRGLDRALDVGVDEINVVVLASDTFCQRNQGTSTAEAVKVWFDLATRAKSAGLRTTATISAAFGCPFEGEVPPGRIGTLAQQIATVEPDEIVLADTIGVGVPTQVVALLELVGAAAPKAKRRCHFHNTRNTGYANAVAALQAGVDALDASAGGFGGCPFSPKATGNIATEDLAYLLGRMDVRTGTSLTELIHTGHWLAERLGRDLPALVGRAGPFTP
jgi:hydroxymethylglutaryl-CoA lyase